MELTKQEAIDKSIELWTWLAQTGKRKEDWPGWEDYGGLDEGNECLEVTCECFLCEYTQGTAWEVNCLSCCPYGQVFGICLKQGYPFDRWAYARTPRTRKKYAKILLEQIKQLGGKE